MCRKSIISACLFLALGVTNVTSAATDPYPADGAIYEDIWVTLSWTPRAGAASYDVYVGDNFDAVNDGTDDTFRGNQTSPSFVIGFPGFPYPEGLVSGTTYYWRIDEIWADGTIFRGTVWSFMVPPKTAYDPVPSDGGMFIGADVTLSWTAGFGAKMHTVYFGDNFDDVNNAVVGIPQQATTYTPGTLELEKTYYWRVDEFDGTATYKGNVWNFEVTPDQGWVPFIPGAEPGTLHEVKLKASDNTGITVDSDIPGMYVSDVPVDGEVYQKLNIPYAGHTTEIGKPEVPVIRTYLEIPYDVNVAVEVVYSDFAILEEYNVYPAQKPFTGHEIPEFVIDHDAYATDAFYPTEIAFVEEPIIIRGHRIVTLTICPVQCSPEPRLLRIYSKIEVRVSYDHPAQIEGIEERLESEPFELLCEAFVLNYKHPDEYLSRRYKDVGSPSVDYLIISHDDFDTQVEPLADWKENKGFKTEIIITNTLCTNPAVDDVDEITNYLKNAYNTWDPPPTYVLLVGDSEYLPTHYKTVHPYHGSKTPTDLYYGTVDGTDHFPDIFVGRISVDTATQTTTIVNKILDYEQNPPTNAGFYDEISLCAYFQDNNGDNTEDSHAYISTSMELFTFLNPTYTVERIYSTNAANPAKYNDGTNLPNDLLMANGFLWDGDTTDITDAINAGRFLVNHNDHGSSRNYFGTLEGWDEPRFATVDIPGLTNDLTPNTNINEFPIVFSINCMTGWFDGETDTDTTKSYESLCEEMLRHQNGGAVAAIGATRASYTLLEFDLNKGLIDAIWPGFDPTATTGAMYELGQVLTYGKVYMARIWGISTYELTQVEQYHLFGDPEMWIWTEQPTALTVTHPASIGSGGVQEFVVTVKDAGNNPVHHAAVCLLKKDENLQEVGYTDPSGNIIFSVTPSTAGTMAITVTKRNYLPYEGSIVVTGQGAAITVSPDAGPPGISVTITGNNFQGTEAVNITMGGTAVGSATTSSGSFSKPFTVPSLPVGPTNVVAVGQSSSRAAATVFRVLQAQPLPDPYIYSQWDSTTWHLAGGVKTWDNPCIKFKDPSGTVVPSGNLKVGTTYTIEATIHSSSSVAASGTTVTFTWAFWGVGQKIWNLIGTDTVNLPAATVAPSSAVASMSWFPSVTGHTCLRVEIHHPLDSNLKNNMGQDNTYVHPITSPAEIFIDIHNPTDTPGLVYLEVTQGDTREPLDLWETRISRPYPQVLEPNEVQTATLLVDAPDGAEIGETRTISVTGTINGEIIGGVEIQVVKVAKDLVAHYSFENNTTDISGNGLDGTVIGDPEFVDGVEGMALDFNGDDYVDCGTNAVLNNLSDAMTVSAWVNIRSVTHAWMVMVNKGETAWRLGVNNGTTGIHYGFTGGTRDWQQANTATELSFDEWYHVAATYDTSVGAQVYIDGVLDASNPDPGGVATNEMPLLLGENPEATGRFFDGMLDEVKIYNRSLSAEEIGYLAGLR